MNSRLMAAAIVAAGVLSAPVAQAEQFINVLTGWCAASMSAF